MTRPEKKRRRTLSAPKRDGKRGPLSPAKERTIFVAMPFSPEYEDVYLVIAGAVKAVGANCDKVDMAEFIGDINKEIENRIRKSMAVIADLSEAKPNVLFEVGFAQALRRPTIFICSTSLDDLPFDVRNSNALVYAKGQTHKLRDNLIKRLQAITK